MHSRSRSRNERERNERVLFWMRSLPPWAIVKRVQANCLILQVSVPWLAFFKILSTICIVDLYQNLLMQSLDRPKKRYIYIIIFYLQSMYKPVIMYDHAYNHLLVFAMLWGHFWNQIRTRLNDATTLNIQHDPLAFMSKYKVKYAKPGKKLIICKYWLDASLRIFSSVNNNRGQELPYYSNFQF